MQKFFTLLIKYNAYLLLALYCSIALLVIKLQEEEIFVELRNNGLEFSAAVNEQFMSIAYFLHLSHENSRLMRLNTDLLNKILHYDNILLEERRYKALFSDSTFNASPYIKAQVVDRKFSATDNMLIIDSGWRHGVKKDMAVLVPQGLVGRVVAVSENYAKVMPVIHPDFRVCVVADSSNCTGILVWNGGREWIANVDHIPISSRLRLNEQFRTADFSTFALRGIPVGRIVRIVPDKLFYTVDVRLSVDFSALHYVLVAPQKVEAEKVRIVSDSSAALLRTPQL